MNARYEPEALQTLLDKPRTERRYIAPGTSRGYTTDLEQAQRWAQIRASRMSPATITTVLYQDVQLSEWRVASEYEGTYQS